jgi:pyridoxine 5-phosphate synthase
LHDGLTASHLPPFGIFCSVAIDVRPHDVCLVPENRQEITTEGGLDVAAGIERVAQGVRRLADAGSRVALFIAPDLAQIEAAKRSGAPVIELHTGTYAEATGGERARELGRLNAAAKRAASLGLEVHAGHGLTYHNVQPVAAIPEIVELNIGHCIIARAIFSGLEAAVRDMKNLMIGARQ